jgi:hypothetical protein
MDEYPHDPRDLVDEDVLEWLAPVYPVVDVAWDGDLVALAFGNKSRIHRVVVLTRETAEYLARSVYDLLEEPPDEST